MKIRTLSITLALSVYAATAFGQDYAFKVLVNKGKNEVKSGSNWEPVKVGASLKSLDELKVSENAYVGLIHVSGKPLEVKNAGKYKVDDLVKKVGTGASVLNKYTDFILSSNTQKKNTMTATGAVHRGLNTITLFLPTASAYVFGDSVDIEWSKDKAGPPYTVTFSSVFGDELYKTETSQNRISISLSSPAFSKENDIQVQVFSKAEKKESEAHTLRKLSKADRERINNSYKELAAQTTANTAINKLYRAGFFEQNKLLIDAATAYQEAIKLEPNVPNYQEVYEDFLLRNGLKEPKQK
jgi:hypothetical protein